MRKAIIPLLTLILSFALVLGLWGKILVDIAVKRAVDRMTTGPRIEAEVEGTPSPYAPEQPIPDPRGDWQSWESTRD